MDSSDDSINRIAAWLGAQLKSPSVRVQRDFDREAIVFHIAAVDAGIGDLEISQEAIDDHAPDIVISDLQTHDVPARLRRDPTMRLAYSRDRDVPHLETRWIICDRKRYRFVRDSDHTVRVYDSND